METIELLQAEIQMKEHAISKLKAQIKNKEKQQSEIELDPDDFEDQFNDSLDESIPEIEIGCLTYSPSHVLKNVDPVAYRCSLNDFVDSCYSVSDLDEWKEIQEDIENIESELSDIENEIDDLYSQIEDLED